MFIDSLEIQMKVCEFALMLIQQSELNGSEHMLANVVLWEKQEKSKFIKDILITWKIFWLKIEKSFF